MDIKSNVYVIVAEKDNEQYILCQDIIDNVHIFSMKPWSSDLNFYDVFISWTDDICEVFKIMDNLGNDFFSVKIEIDPVIMKKLIALEAILEDDKIYIK